MSLFKKNILYFFLNGENWVYDCDQNFFILKLIDIEQNEAV